MQSRVLTPPLRRPGEQSRHQKCTNEHTIKTKSTEENGSDEGARRALAERETATFTLRKLPLFLLGIQDSRFTSAPLVWDTKGWVMADGTGQSIGDICAELCPVVYINVASKVQAGILDNDRYIM